MHAYTHYILLIYLTIAYAVQLVLRRHGTIAVVLALLWPVWLLCYMAAKVGEWVIDPWLN